LNARLSLTLILLALVTASALGVVYTRHHSRSLAVELGELENARDETIAEWSRLQLEQAWLADASHVESKARRELGMDQPADTEILVVEP
jgi:cell division protein FtsL